MVEADGNDRGGQSPLNLLFWLKAKEDCGWKEWRLGLDVSKDDIVTRGQCGFLTIAPGWNPWQ